MSFKATKLIRRMTTRKTYMETLEAKSRLMDKGYLVRSFAMNDEAGDFWLILYERDEPVHICGEPEGFCWECVDAWAENQERRF